MFGYDIGLDLGTSSIVMSVPGKGVVVNEPSYVAYDVNTDKILYAGKRAYQLEGREPEGVKVIKPVKDGAVSNYFIARQMIHYFINKIIKHSVFRPRVVAAVSSLATDVEKRSLVSVITGAGARSVCLIEESLCAAFGCGIDPLQSQGIFIIDIGGGTTDMAVITQGSISQIDTVKIGGDEFDAEIARYMQRKHHLIIGARTAEEVKNRISSAVTRDEELVMEVKGRDENTGLPSSCEVSGEEIHLCLAPLFSRLVRAAKELLLKTSPQLIADLKQNGVIITGGCSSIYGLDKMFSQRLKIKCQVSPRAELCVSRGTIVALNKMHILDSYGYKFVTRQDVRTG